MFVRSGCYRAIPPLLQISLKEQSAAGDRQNLFDSSLPRGILNEIGELLDPNVAVLLIGERPGCHRGELSPTWISARKQHTDANRN